MESLQEDSEHRRTVSSAQQSVVWESAPRSTTGGAQSSPEAGGIEHLTEQLLDREAAKNRPSGSAEEGSDQTMTRKTTGEQSEKEKSGSDPNSQKKSSTKENAPKSGK